VLFHGLRILELCAAVADNLVPDELFLMLRELVFVEELFPTRAQERDGVLVAVGGRIDLVLF